MPRSARLDGDELNQLIVNGRVGPVSEPAIEAQRQLLLRGRNLCTLANNFAAAGFYPVIDHVVPDRHVLSSIVEQLSPRPVLFVTLAPSLEVAQRRNASRAADEQVHHDLATLRVKMMNELGTIGWWFDTSELTPEATVESLLAEAGGRAVVAA
jgi:chloramphenicol 3-O-phosphotransferase